MLSQNFGCRHAYLYADPDRMQGTYLIDLTSPAGQNLFARQVDGVLNQANFSAVEYDGIEKLLPMSPFDFNHSAKTVTSPMFRAPPSPDWFCFQRWPLLVGMGMANAYEQAHALLNNPATSIETTGVAPGLGPCAATSTSFWDYFPLSALYHPTRTV